MVHLGKEMNTKDIGERSEAQVLATLLKGGKTVLKPFGDNQRYDLVVDEDGEFLRVQCKTGVLKKGSIYFPTCSSYGHRGRGKKGYKREADIFAVYCPATDKVYIIPVEEAPERQCYLRVEKTKNSQDKRIRWAEKYEYTGA